MKQLVGDSAHRGVELLVDAGVSLERDRAIRPVTAAAIGADELRRWREQVLAQQAELVGTAPQREVGTGDLGGCGSE